MITLVLLGKENNISSKRKSNMVTIRFKARDEDIHQEEGQQKVESHGGNHPHHLLSLVDAQTSWKVMFSHQTSHQLSVTVQSILRQ